MWNPPLIEERTQRRRSPLSEGAELLADLVSEGMRTICFLRVAQGHRADPAVRPDAAGGARPGRPRGSDRPVPRRLHAAAAPGDRGPPGGRRPPRRRRDRRPRAGHRHRRARRLDLRDLPGHGGQPAPDVGEGGPAQRGVGRLHRRRRRPRPVLLPPPGRVPRPPGRGGDPRSRERADPWPPRARGRLRGAARRIGLAAGRRRRPHPRFDTGASARTSWSARVRCGEARTSATSRADRATRRARSRCAPPRSTRSPWWT